MVNQTEQIDVIIIGAGHNGLVAAGYLENVPVQLPLLHALLQEKGYDVVAQRAIASGVPDEDVIALATQLGRTIITFDTDFPILKFKHSRYMPFEAIPIQES